MSVRWGRTNKEAGETQEVEGTVDRDDCNRPDTTLERLAALMAAFKGSTAPSRVGTPRSFRTARRKRC